jgi:hypothetical protein
MAGAVVRFEIMGADGDALERFYGALFDWRVEAVEGTGGGYRTVHPGEGIEGGIGAFPGAPSYVTIYVHAPDLEGTVRRAVELGASVLAPPREVRPGMRTAVLRDPEGHVLGLIDGA